MPIDPASPAPTRLGVEGRLAARRALEQIRRPTPASTKFRASETVSVPAIEVPTEVYLMLVEILEHLAGGTAVAIAPIAADVAAQQREYRARADNLVRESEELGEYDDTRPNPLLRS